MQSKPTVIMAVARDMQRRCADESSGHDWHHIRRVWENARYIGRKERADMFVVELGALLHDIADHKFHHNDHTVGPREARKLLTKFRLDPATINHVAYIVGNVSFGKSGRRKNMKTLEGKVVQDADRLDAAGAIAIARTFHYGGFRKRPIYDPRIRPYKQMSVAAANRGASSLHHFYEKLLHIPELMNTQTGKRLSLHRRKIIEQFLKEFHREWGGADLK
ncbi:MAG: HD domain-containing protein [Patescibacteria group bacterium]